MIARATPIAAIRTRHGSGGAPGTARTATRAPWRPHETRATISAAAGGRTPAATSLAPASRTAPARRLAPAGRRRCRATAPRPRIAAAPATPRARREATAWVGGGPRGHEPRRRSDHECRPTDQHHQLSACDAERQAPGGAAGHLRRLLRRRPSPSCSATIPRSAALRARRPPASLRRRARPCATTACFGLRLLAAPDPPPLTPWSRRVRGDGDGRRRRGRVPSPAFRPWSVTLS